MITNQLYKYVVAVLKKLGVPFVDPCDPSYTPECVPCEGAPESIVEPIVSGNPIANHISGSGTPAVIQESVTLLVDNEDGTYTHINELNQQVTFSSGWTTVTNNNDGTWTYLYPDGNEVTLDICELLNFIPDNGNTLTEGKVVSLEGGECELKLIPTHSVECLMDSNLPSPAPDSPSNPPTVIAEGSTIREEYYNGYVIYTYTDGAWVGCGRNFTTGPVLQPSK